MLEDVVTVENRSLAMAHIIQLLLGEAIQDWKWIMPADSDECIIRALNAKALETGVPERKLEDLKKLSTSDLIVKMAKHGLRILPNPHECHVELRKASPPIRSLCTLTRTRSGMCACGIPRPTREDNNPKLRILLCSSVLASQAWSLAHLFPQGRRIWTIGDVGGRVGVVLGHAGFGPAYISDPSPRRLHAHQINNGPLELFNDRCQEAYERCFYIKSLGQTQLTRPSDTPLIVVIVSSKKQPMPLIMSQVKPEDFVMSRTHTGAINLPLIGHPRRNATDVWYTDRCPLGHPLGEFEPQDVHTPRVTDKPPLSHPLAPHYRACQLLGVTHASSQKDVKAKCREMMLSITESSIDYHRAMQQGGTTLLMRAVAGDVIPTSFKITRKKELLFFLWMNARVTGSSIHDCVSECGPLHTATLYGKQTGTDAVYCS